jgi:hypothetical protein
MKYYLLVASRFAVGSLLLIAGVGKLLNLQFFRKVLSSYEVLPSLIVPTLSIALPAIELTTGVAILLKLFGPAAQFLAAVLFGLFAIVIGVNLACGQHEIPCGCFGRGQDAICWRFVIRNLALVGLAFLSAGKLLSVSLALLVLYGLAAGASLFLKPGVGAPSGPSPAANPASRPCMSILASESKLEVE